MTDSGKRTPPGGPHPDVVGRKIVEIDSTGTEPSSEHPAVTQAALKQRLRFQAQLLDSVRESLIATDLDGLITYWGKGAQTLYGYHAQEVIGKPVTLIVNPDAASAEIERMRQVRETGSWRGEYMQLRKDGRCFWADTVLSRQITTQGSCD